MGDQPSVSVSSMSRLNSGAMNHAHNAFAANATMMGTSAPEMKRLKTPNPVSLRPLDLCDAFLIVFLEFALFGSWICWDLGSMYPMCLYFFGPILVKIRKLIKKIHSFIAGSRQTYS